MFVNFTFYDDDQKPIEYRIWARSISKNSDNELVLEFNVGSFYTDEEDLDKHIDPLISLLRKWDNCWILYGREDGPWDRPDVSLAGYFTNRKFHQLRFS